MEEGEETMEEKDIGRKGRRGRIRHDGIKGGEKIRKKGRDSKDK